MSKLDQAKEKLAEYRRWQNYCVTILIALVAFIATSYDKTEPYLLWVSAIGIVMVILGVLFFFLKIKKEIDKIEKL